jgi:hypothetical protein
MNALIISALFDVPAVSSAPSFAADPVTNPEPSAQLTGRSPLPLDLTLPARRRRYTRIPAFIPIPSRGPRFRLNRSGIPSSVCPVLASIR